MREHWHVDVMAAASVCVMNMSLQLYHDNTHSMLHHITVGTGVDCTITEHAETIAREVGFTGKLLFVSSKPDGTERKLMDVSRLHSLGWQAKIGLQEGISDAYAWTLENATHARTRHLD